MANVHNNSSCLVFVSLTDAEQYIRNVIDFLNLQGEQEARPEILMCMNATHLCQIPKYLTLPSLALKLCRKNKTILPNERSALLKKEDTLVAIQLCLAQLGKEIHGDFVANTNDVLELEKIISTENSCNKSDVKTLLEKAHQSYRNFLLDSNVFDETSLVNMLKKDVASESSQLKQAVKDKTFIVLGYPCTVIEKEVMTILFSDFKVLDLNVAVPLNSSFVVVNDEVSEIKKTDCMGEDLVMMPELTTPVKMANCDAQIEMTMVESTWDEVASKSSDSTEKIRVSATEKYLTRLMIAYLRLLVNTRDELALALVISGPGWKLDHEAFTAIKREAKLKKMPMFQTILSYVLRIRLGGKGYAPGSNSFLLPYTKELSEFVDLTQKLQSIVEEEPKSVLSVKRVINNLKNHICKCSGSGLRRSSVDEVAERLHGASAMIHGDSEEMAAENKTRSGQTTMKVLMGIVDMFSCLPCEHSLHIDGTNSQGTPLQIPSLTSLFRSPETTTDPSCASTSVAIFKPADKQRSKDKHPLLKVTAASTTSTRSVEQGETANVSLKVDKENHRDMKSNLEAKPVNTTSDAPHQRQTKRSLLADITNISKPPAKKLKSEPIKKKVKAKDKPLPKGQTTLSKFFRV